MLAFWLGVIGVIGFVWLLVVSRSFRITIAIIVGVGIALASIYAWLIKMENEASIAKACLESRQEHSDFYARNSTGIIADPTQFAGLVECSRTDQWRRLTEVERRDIAPNCGFKNAHLIWPGKCFTEEQKGVRAYNACEGFIRNGGFRGQETDRMTIPDPTDKGESIICYKSGGWDHAAR
jgi:hypothetical protein